MSARTWDARAVPIVLEALPDGAGQTAGASGLADLGDTSFGVWEITPGTSTDAEADEVAVILSGRGTVEDLDSGEVVELGPGTVLRLTAGTRTRWTIEERLRKVYVVR